MTIGLAINGCSNSQKKKQFDQRKQDWLVQKLGLRRHQRFDVIQAEPPFLLLSQWSSARRVLRTYNPGQKALRKWWNIRDSCNFLVVVNRLQRCLWGEERGWLHVTSKASQQQILAEICPINRLFTASCSHGTKLPYCWTRDVLGQPNRRKLLFYMMSALSLCCPSTSLALQHSRQTDSRLRKQLTFRDATTGFPAKRLQTKYHYLDLMHPTGSSKFLTLPDQSNLSDVTSSVWSFCTPYTRVGSITSRCSQNEPTLLPWTDSRTHGFKWKNTIRTCFCWFLCWISWQMTKRRRGKVQHLFGI